jgi:ATP synthase protein I
MSQPGVPPASSEEGPSGDPWHAFGYIVSGVGVYGLVGWLTDQLLGTSFVVAVGILLGAGFGIYLTFARFNTAVPQHSEEPPGSTPTDPSDQT